MIRRGKTDGWLSQPAQRIDAWASLNGVKFNGVQIGTPAESSKGAGLIVKNGPLDFKSNPLIEVPRELILSLENVQLHAKVDLHLREILERMGDYGRTPRGAILLFLLVVATNLCPDVDKKIGVSNPFTEYVKTLPMEFLPTFWTEEELESLVGTSLAAATRAKIKSLEREFENLREATRDLTWCQQYWWNETSGLITLDDWKQVDAMYRSRALEFPGIGDCMAMVTTKQFDEDLLTGVYQAPCIDIANHAGGASTVALYEADPEGNGLLLLREGKSLAENEEVTITYGDEKGACEMIFSYGFLDENQESANDIFLGLEIPPDDPLKGAKIAFADSAPGVRLIRRANELQWVSEYVWIICVNEEDGLAFQVDSSPDGERRLTASWKGQEFQDLPRLKQMLEIDPMWDLFKLRAAAIIQVRIEEQLDALKEVDGRLGGDYVPSGNVRESAWKLAHRLHDLEQVFLEASHEDLENQKTRLLKSKTVLGYLQAVSGMTFDSDFS